MKFCDEKIQKHLLNGGKIKRRDFDVEVVLNKDKRLSCDGSSYYILTQYDLTVDDWEIIEPKYNWDKIIKDKILCVFSHQENFEYCGGLNHEKNRYHGVPRRAERNRVYGGSNGKAGRNGGRRNRKS